MSRIEKSMELKHNGNNCCQSVLLSFADELDLSEDVLKRMGAAFGAGMGGMEGTCGALCGAEMVLGLKEYSGKPLMKEAKTIYQSFKEKSGATICKELKGIGTGTVLCSCDDCVRNAVQIVEEIQ
ncbi:MAG: C_GCAxxG_C_C family protein [Selenomonadaceae bacterium]|nr:C_GCAxxG_C_C family protein [Selenomonadaceae bacterium]MBR1858224.1 C_GCAxxG_C_C family protein [Selenomonadaceae bacterium]